MAIIARSAPRECEPKAETIQSNIAPDTRTLYPLVLIFQLEVAKQWNHHDYCECQGVVVLNKCKIRAPNPVAATGDYGEYSAFKP